MISIFFADIDKSGSCLKEVNFKGMLWLRNLNEEKWKWADIKVSDVSSEPGYRCIVTVACRVTDALSLCKVEENIYFTNNLDILWQALKQITMNHWFYNIIIEYMFKSFWAISDLQS